MKKFVGFFVVAGLLLVPNKVLAGFSDIRSGSQLESYVDHLVEQGIISGYPDGSFKPDRTINRAEALKIIFETVEDQAGAGTDSGFPDVPKNEWYAPYVATAKQKSIVGGYPDGTFRPTQEVNRAEFIKMVMSALPFFNTTPKETSVAVEQYSDVYDLWYTPYVSAGLQLGFLNKTSELKPTAPMQRQDAVEIVYRISKYLEENPSSLAPSDIPYVPEESFTVSDPTKLWYQPSPQLGPDKFVVERDINRTEVFHKLHGYNLDLPELMEAYAFEDTSYMTKLKSADGCITLLAFHSGETVQETYQDIINPDSFMVPYLETKLEPLTQYSPIKAYRVKIIWDDDEWVTHIVELPQGTLELISEAYEYDRCIQKYPDLILDGMTIR